MREQLALPYPRRASATPEELAARRVYPPANPHRVGNYAGLHPEDQPSMTGQDDVPDSYYDTRMPSSARRYRYTDEDQQVITQGNRRLVIHQGPPPRARRRLHFQWLFWVGILMFLVIGGWWALGKVETRWVNQQNTWSYGYPRTYQTDAVVGHNDSAANPSHFIALNLNGHIEVIEIPGGDPSHEKVYAGPALFGDDAGLVPVTVSFSDVNGDGKPDMEIHIQDQTIIFLNDGTQFKAPKQ